MKPFLLIYPPYEGRLFLQHRLPFPVGPLYIASYLKSKKIKAEVIDFGYPTTKLKANKPKGLEKDNRYYRYGWDDIKIKQWLKKNLKKYNNIVGISSMMYTSYHSAYNLIEQIKSVNENIIVVVGGPHATASPFHVIKNSKADYVCVGEGEEVIHRFLKGKKIKGLYSKKEIKKLNGEIPFRATVEDVNALPLPDKRLIINERPMDYMYVTFSRGCPHKCSFCGSHLIQGRKWRHKSVSHSVKELLFYYEKFNIKKFEVEDDNLCAGSEGKQWLKELCKEVIKLNKKFKFHVPHGIPVYAVADKELAKLLWEAGFRNMVLPLESTNKDVLKHMKKTVDTKMWRKALRNWKYEKNIPNEIILGYPFVETIETMLQTIMDISKRKGRAWAGHFRLNMGTDLFNQCLAEGLVDKSYDPIHAHHWFLENPRFNIKDLKELMSLCRGVNFGTSLGFDCFTEDPKVLKDKNFKMVNKLKMYSTVATGSFGFKKGQTELARLILMRFGVDGRPMLSSTKEEITFTGLKPSRVYSVLHKYLVDNDLIIKDIAGKNSILKFLKD